MDSKPHIVLIGDTIIDVTTTGRAIGLSAETPTITLKASSTRRTDGGAAFVSRNLDALGCPHMFLSNHSVDGKRPVAKHRFWADGYKLFQVNTGDSEPIGRSQEDVLLRKYRPRPRGLLVISDYRHGLITERVAARLIQTARESGCTILVDSQVSKAASNHQWYADADIMFVNDNEQMYVPDSVEDHGTVVVKMGADGARMYGCGPLGVRYIPGAAVDVVDTCGAGDAFLAAFVAAYADGHPDPLYQANAWAAAKCAIAGMGVPDEHA